MAIQNRAGHSAPERAAYDVLTDLGFPLPLDVEAVRLHLGLELRRDAGLPARVRGLLLLPERLIVVQQGLAPRAEERVVLHECGHEVLTEHRAVFYRCSAFDLEVGVRRRLEAEANVFATVLRFGGVPEDWLHAEPPSIERVRDLADLAGASFESALRWFVAHSDRPAWALLCDPPAPGGTGGTVRVRYGYRSPAARPCPWPTAAPVQRVRRAGRGSRPDWPDELAAYAKAGAEGWDVYATAYWTCVLLW